MYACTMWSSLGRRGRWGRHASPASRSAATPTGVGGRRRTAASSAHVPRPGRRRPAPGRRARRHAAGRSTAVRRPGHPARRRHRCGGGRRCPRGAARRRRHAQDRRARQPRARGRCDRARRAGVGRVSARPTRCRARVPAGGRRGRGGGDRPANGRVPGRPARTGAGRSHRRHRRRRSRDRRDGPGRRPVGARGVGRAGDRRGSRRRAQTVELLGREADDVRVLEVPGRSAPWESGTATSGRPRTTRSWRRWRGSRRTRREGVRARHGGAVHGSRRALRLVLDPPAVREPPRSPTTSCTRCT